MGYDLAFEFAIWGDLAAYSLAKIIRGLLDFPPQNYFAKVRRFEVLLSFPCVAAVSPLPRFVCRKGRERGEKEQLRRQGGLAN